MEKTFLLGPYTIANYSIQDFLSKYNAVTGINESSMLFKIKLSYSRWPGEETEFQEQGVVL